MSSKTHPATNRHDVEIARTLSRTETQSLAIKCVGGVVAVAVAYFPIRPVADAIAEFAGKSTGVDVNVTIGVVGAISLSGAIGLLIKNIFQRRTILRQRKRITDLETQLGINRGGAAG